MALQPTEQLQEEHTHDTQPTLNVHKVAFQGERGAFGDEAVRRYFVRDGVGTALASVQHSKQNPYPTAPLPTCFVPSPPAR